MAATGHIGTRPRGAVRLSAADVVAVATVGPLGRVRVVLARWAPDRGTMGAPYWQPIDAPSPVLGVIATTPADLAICAEQVLAVHGWVRVGEWTTAGRYPAVRVKRVRGGSDD